MVEQPNRLRLLHVVAPAAFGGLESVVRLLVEGQRAAGHESNVATILERADQRHPFILTLAAEGVDAKVVVAAGRRYGRERAAVRELCEVLKPSIVHTHGYRPDVVDGNLAHKLGIRVVTTVHGFTGYGIRGKLYEALQRRSHRRFDAVVAVSEPIATRLRRSGVRVSRLHVIPNAFDGRVSLLAREEARNMLGLPQNAFVAGWVGRLSAEKGPDVFLEALATIPDLRVVGCMVGDGPQRQELERSAKTLGLADRVFWSGGIENAARIFSAFDVFVLSSRTEGTPMVLLEAMNGGIPIVSTVVGGVPDVVGQAEALLVSSEDARELAAAVRAIHANPAAARKRTIAARQRLASAFGEAPFLSKYDAVYRSVLATADDMP